MALNFPASPSVGQTYPAPPVEGVPVYRWDGEKWTTATAPPSKQPIYADGSIAMDAQLTLVAPPVDPTDAAAKSYVDSIGPPAGSVRYDVAQSLSGSEKAQGRDNIGALSTSGNQTITGGFAVTPKDDGNFPASFTPNPLLGNYQYGVNNGAFTVNAPTVDCAIDFLVSNSASAGGITFTGYTYAAGNYGDVLTTTNGHRFIISIRRIGGVSTLTIKALQ